MNRRQFLSQTVAAGLGAVSLRGLVCSTAAAAAPAGGEPKPSLAGEVGVTTGSFVKQLTIEPAPGKLGLLDLPKIMRDELGMRVIDLMTATLASLEPDYLDRLRSEAARAGCLLTNLKMNQPGLDMASADAEKRGHALSEYKRTIDAAARLGVRWVRPLPGTAPVDRKIYAASYRELIDYAAPHGITLLIENNGWMRNDPEAIPAVIKAVGPGLHAQPDTGNWTDAARYDGLARAFPLAVSCDFKALKLGPEGEHEAYDLKRCFQIGWDAGFRGPWCLEHFHDDLKQLFREMMQLGDQLRKWMRASGAAKNP